MNMYHIKKIKILIYFLAASTLFAQEKEFTVSIKVTAEIEDSAKVYIVGNEKELGQWNPSAVELKKN